MKGGAFVSVNVELRNQINCATVELPPEHLDWMFEARLAQTIDYYDANAESYARRFKSVDLQENRQRFLERLPSRTGVVLDAGCGPGRDLRLFKCDGYKAVGIDKSAELLRIAKVAGHSVVEGDLRQLPFKSAMFSGIWSCASLVHLPDAEANRALTEFQRVLVPGGSLFISVRYGCGTEERLDPSSYNRWFYLYSVPQIERLLIKSGFVDIEAVVEPGAMHGTWINIHARTTWDNGMAASC